MILTESAYESALLTGNNSRLDTRKLVAKRYLLLLNLLFAQTADVRASVKMMQELHYNSDRIPFTPVNANVRVSERSRGLFFFIGDRADSEVVVDDEQVISFAEVINITCVCADEAKKDHIHTQLPLVHLYGYANSATLTFWVFRFIIMYMSSSYRCRNCSTTLPRVSSSGHFGLQL